jgi:hypothetical protein
MRARSSQRTGNERRVTPEAESEENEDDVSFVALMNEVERRHDWQAFNDWYRAVWDDHAKYRGYERKAND